MAARAKEEKKQREAKDAEQKRLAKDQEKLQKLSKEFARYYACHPTHDQSQHLVLMDCICQMQWVTAAS